MAHMQEEDDLEWEEWDGSSPFLHHCIAGSTAGVAEHTLLYPVDTVKTHLQCASCPHHGSAASRSAVPRTTQFYSTNTHLHRPAVGMMSTMRHLMSQATAIEASSTGAAGASRLWRGVQTMAVGCVPAHALSTLAAMRQSSTYTRRMARSHTGAAWQPVPQPRWGTTVS